MTAKDLNKIKASLVKLLKKNKTFQPEVDNVLIDQYIFNLVIIEDAQNDVANRGVMVQLGKDKNFMQQNFALGAIFSAIKSNQSILKQLGLEKVIKAEPLEDKDNGFKSLHDILNGN